jgi:hypothetical protein
MHTETSDYRAIRIASRDEDMQTAAELKSCRPRLNIDICINGTAFIESAPQLDGKRKLISYGGHLTPGSKPYKNISPSSITLTD